MSFKIQKGKALDSLNLTPLIDVVFLLLIFFLVATQFSQDDQQLPIKLPSAQSAVPMTIEPEELVVHIAQDSSMMVRGQYVDLETLEGILRQSLADNPIQQTVVLRGDKRVEFQTIVSLVDLCNRLKIPSYRFTTASDASTSSSESADATPPLETLQ
jgi:biopolymer transport protein ExbD